jgi:hypothetical protein
LSWKKNLSWKNNFSHGRKTSVRIEKPQSWKNNFSHGRKTSVRVEKPQSWKKNLSQGSVYQHFVELINIKIDTVFSQFCRNAKCKCKTAVFRGQEIWKAPIKSLRKGMRIKHVAELHEAPRVCHCHRITVEGNTTT